MRIRFTKNHNGYQTGDEIDADPGVADAIVNWAKAAEYVTESQPTASATPELAESKSDKVIHRRGGKAHVQVK